MLSVIDMSSIRFESALSDMSRSGLRVLSVICPDQV